jgi:plastocyanin
LALAVALPCATSVASAADLRVMARDASGALATGAVLLRPATGAATMPAPERAQVVQRDRTFVPEGMILSPGSSVAFLNRDPVRHHVYSFSAARRFELKLFAASETPPPVDFREEGMVVLGCNIHDTMAATLYVTRAPLRTLTDASGTGTLRGLAPGRYAIEVWHPRLAAPWTGEVEIAGKDVDLRVEAKGPFVLPAPRAAPSPLADRFKAPRP